MRYRIGEDPSAAGYRTTDDFLVLSAVFGLVLGALLTWIGWKGRQMWLVVWCVGLVAASIAVLVRTSLGGG